MALRLNGSSSGYVELDVPAAAGSHTLTLPDGGGSSGQYLQTNGSGGLSWQTVSSPGQFYKLFKQLPILRQVVLAQPGLTRVCRAQ
jgi:hypothetical protein